MARVIDFPTEQAKSELISPQTARLGGRILEFERRLSARSVTVFRLAKLVGAQEELCVIRNVSTSGLNVEVFSPKSIDTPLGIDIGDNVVRPAKVVWQEGDCVGITLNEEIDVAETLRGIPLPGDRRGRRLRFAINVDGVVGCKGHPKQCQVVEISQGGARLRTDDAETVPERIKLELVGLGNLPGSVRWVQDDYVGIAFTRPLPYRELAAWLPNQSRSRGASPAIDGI